MKYDNIAKYAAKWWADKIGGNAIHDNGDDTFGSVLAGLLADSMIKKPSVEQLESYRALLAKEILKVLEKRGAMSLSCDYSPDGILIEAAKASGIELANYPWKTNMRIDDNKIRVSEGYGAPYALIYDKDYDWSEER